MATYGIQLLVAGIVIGLLQIIGNQKLTDSITIIVLLYLFTYTSFFQLTNRVVVAQSGPTCDALDGLIADAQADNNLECYRTFACDAVTCTSSELPVSIHTTLSLLPCEDPPAVRIVITQGQSILYDSVVDESGARNLGIGRLTVTLDQLPSDGAVGVGVSF